jgi:hypothetical protein
VIGMEITDFVRFYRAPIRRRAWHRLLVALLVVATGGAWLVVSSSKPASAAAHVAVTASTAGTVVTLTGGSLDLGQLRQSLTRSGHRGLISLVAGGAIEVNSDIVVGARATFTVTHSALLLRSDERTHVRLTAQGGELNFSDDTIASWTAKGVVDTNPIGGRADIVATDRGAELNFSHCRVIGLGTDEDDPGVSWRDGAAGTVDDSQFSENWRAAYAYKSGPLTILSSSFTGSQEDGVLLLEPGLGSTVRDSTFANNGQSGLEIAGNVDDLTLVHDTADRNRDAGFLTRVRAGSVDMIGGLVYDNEQAGISAAGGHLSIAGTKVWANETGLSIAGGDVSVIGSDLSANTQDGMYVSGDGTEVTAAADRFDHNSRSGVWVADGQVGVTGGFFDENLTGIRIAGFSHTFRAAGNTITNSIKDGVALDVAPGIQIQGNVIEDNGDSAISTNKTYDLSPILKQNTIVNNQTATRVRKE